MAWHWKPAILWRDLDQSKKFTNSWDMCLRTVNVPSVHGMYDTSVQIATKQITLSQRRLVKKSCYKEDFVASVESVGMAKEVQKQLTEIGNKAGFHIHKLISQKPEVIEDIPVTDWAAEVDLEKKEFPITKALGVVQIVQVDKFSFFFSAYHLSTSHYKKGTSWRKLQQFDMIHLDSWPIVPAKMLMQKDDESSRMGWRVAGPSESRLEGMVWQLDAIRVPRSLKEDRRFAMSPLWWFWESLRCRNVWTTGVWRWNWKDTVSYSKFRVGTTKGHEYSTVRINGSIDWYQINFADKQSTRESHE